MLNTPFGLIQPYNVEVYISPGIRWIQSCCENLRFISDLGLYRYVLASIFNASNIPSRLYLAQQSSNFPYTQYKVQVCPDAHIQYTQSTVQVCANVHIQYTQYMIQIQSFSATSRCISDWGLERYVLGSSIQSRFNLSLQPQVYIKLAIIWLCNFVYIHSTQYTIQAQYSLATSSCI